MRSLTSRVRYTPWFECDAEGISFLFRRHDASTRPRPIWFRLVLATEEGRYDVERCLASNGFRVVDGPPVELVITVRREGTPTLGGLTAARSILAGSEPQAAYESWATYIVRAPTRWLPATSSVVTDRTRTAHDPTC